MTPLFRSRIDAEELHAAISGVAAPEVERRHAPLLRTVSLLDEYEPVRPRPGFLRDLREQLILAAETDLVAAPVPLRRSPSAPQPTPARRRLGTVAASLVIVGGTAGMAAAAQGALPGDPLYPIKRGGEQVETTLHLSEAGKGRANLRQAEQRLAEATALQAEGADPARVVASVEDFRTAAESGAARLFRSFAVDADTADITAVRDFTAQQLPVLEALEAASDDSLEPVLLDAADALTALDQQARTLCGSCGGEALATPDALVSAASDASLDALLTRPAEQARLDAGAFAELDRRQITALVRAAESAAAAAPELPSGADWPVAQPPETRNPVATEVTRAGEPLNETVRGTTRAVDDLVTGIGEVTRDVTQVARPSTPLDRPAEELIDTVDNAVEGVTGVTGSLLD